MAWTTPRTWVTGEIVTAAMMNAHIRDNLNSLLSVYAEVLTSQTTTSATPADLTTDGPSVSYTIGDNAALLCLFTCHMENATNGSESHAGVALSGANTLAADATTASYLTWEQAVGLAGQLSAPHGFKQFTGLAAGATTFKLRYWVTNAGETGTFSRRKIAVLGL